MQIFNVQIFGEDKEYWLAQSVEWKVEWIRANTNQSNDAIIEEFVNNPKISKDKICLTCGLDKQKEEVKEVVLDEIQEVVATDENPIGAKFKKHKRR